MTPLEGISVSVCKYLPATVKDRDGCEVELLGVLASEPLRPPELFGEIDPMRLVFLTGERILHYQI